MTLEIHGDNELNADNNGRGQGGQRRTREDRNRAATGAYETLQEALSPRASTRSLSPRVELIMKWVKLGVENLSSKLLNEYDVKVGSVTREQGFTVHYPGIVIAMNKRDSNRVVCHTMLIHDGMQLEAKGKRRYFKGEDITQIPTPSATWSKKYEGFVKEVVQELFPKITDIRFSQTGFTTLPAELIIPEYPQTPNPEVNVMRPVTQAVVESLSSYERFLRRDNDAVKLSQLFDPNRQTIHANIDQIPAIEYDEVGNPRRSDFCISLSIRDRDEDKESNNDDDLYNTDRSAGSGTILRVTGYVLPYYTMPDLTKPKPQNFGINVVVTNISGDSSPSPELFLYGLSTVSALMADDMWVDGFTPSIISGTPNRNLGGLFLEIPDPKDPKSPMERRTYGVSERDALLDDVDYLFSDKIIVSVDCAPEGPLAWITDFFAFPDAENTDNLVEAANNLTNYKFDAFAGDNVRVVDRAESRRFYTGSVDTETGRRDIREVDYLYLINAFNENHSAATAGDWDRSLQDSSEYGIFTRKSLTDEVYGVDQYKITSFVDRQVIDPDFFADLVDAVSDVGMLPRLDDYSRNHRPRARLEAANVTSAMSGRDIGSAYKSTSRGGSQRYRGNYYRD